MDPSENGSSSRDSLDGDRWMRLVELMVLFEVVDLMIVHSLIVAEILRVLIALEEYLSIFVCCSFDLKRVLDTRLCKLNVRIYSGLQPVTLSM